MTDMPLRVRTLVLAALVVVGRFAFAEAPAEEHPMPPTVEAGAKMVELFTEKNWYEGPSWDPATKKLYFTKYTKQNQQILRVDEPGKTTVWMDHTEDINGTYVTHEGRMLGAQTNKHSIVSMKIGATGPEDVKVLFHDDTLNQPNDVREAPNGDVYFSDPDFAKKKSSAVYLVKPDGKGTKIITDMTLPNGLVVSLDGKTLFVSDSAEKTWRAYPIKADGTVGEGKVFFEPKTADKRDPDGMTIDEKGNLYCTGRGGVWVVSPEGKELGLIPFKEQSSNVCFGGEDGKTLFVTNGNRVVSLQMNVCGGQYKKGN